MRIHFVSSRLQELDVFSHDEVERLRAHAAEHPLRKLLQKPRWKEESAIDFTYTSAQIEGNTYNLADTITLLKLGRTAGGKTYYEARMLVNLRDTYEMVLKEASALVARPLDGLREIHRSLMAGLLEDQYLGATRKTNQVTIAGSEYMPPDGVQFLERHAIQILDTVDEISEPFSASLYAACNLSYLQFFEDGNKRTSRVFQNAILMANGLPPVQFPVSMVSEYLAAQLSYYREGGYAPHRGFMVQAYAYTYPLRSSSDTAAPGVSPRPPSLDDR